MMRSAALCVMICSIQLPVVGDEPSAPVLPNNSAVVEFSKLSVPNNKESQYVAVVTFKDSDGQIRKEVHNLGPSNSIDIAVAKWVSHLQSPKITDELVRSGEAVSRFLSPVKKSFMDSHIVFIRSTGCFEAVPWIAIPDEKSKTIWGDRIAFVMLSDASESRGRERRWHQRTTALFVGDLNGSVPMLSEGQDPAALSYLKSITATFSDSWKISILTPEQASVANVTEAIQRSALIHISGHVAPAPVLSSPLASVRPEYEFHLFGLKNKRKGPLSGVDGLGESLTTSDVAALDMSSVDMAVLSFGADIPSSRAVTYAFHLGGVKSVLSTRWSTDPAADRALLTEFYRNLNEKRMTTSEALRAAQQTIRRYYDRQTGIVAKVEVDGVAPYFWAGWMLSGEWK